MWKQIILMCLVATFAASKLSSKLILRSKVIDEIKHLRHKHKDVHKPIVKDLLNKIAVTMIEGGMCAQYAGAGLAVLDDAKQNWGKWGKDLMDLVFAGLVEFQAYEKYCKPLFSHLKKNLGKLKTNPTHYGDPENGCMSDEIKGGIQGVQGEGCFPECTGGKDCPTDYPEGDTAPGVCAVNGDKGKMYCILQCQGVHEGKCPTTAKCLSIFTAGICLYHSDDANKGSHLRLDVKKLI